jgi:hypothetical protein
VYSCGATNPNVILNIHMFLSLHCYDMVFIFFRYFFSKIQGTKESINIHSNLFYILRLCRVKTLFPMFHPHKYLDGFCNSHEFPSDFLMIQEFCRFFIYLTKLFSIYPKCSLELYLDKIFHQWFNSFVLLVASVCQIILGVIQY